MEKIDITKYNLPVAEREIKLPDNTWLYEAIKFLVNQRIAHCRSQLEKAIKKGEAYVNSNISPIVFYKNTNGEYGHFSEPVYNNMIEFLNHTDHIECYLTRGIIQQALRQYLYDFSSIHAFEDLGFHLDKYDKTYKDLEGALTELLLVMPS